MGVFGKIGGIGGNLLKTFGGAQGGALAPFVAPIVGSLDDLFGSFGGNGGGNARDGGDAALKDTQSGGSRLNVLRVGQQIPSPVGTIRFSPSILPTWSEPTTGGRELATNILAPIPGPVKLEDIEVNDTPIGSFDSEVLESETREGQDSDTALTLITQSVFEDIKNTLVPSFLIAGGSARDLAIQSPATDSIPKPIVVASRKVADEVRLLFEMPAFQQTGNIGISSTALRLRMRKKGDSTWRVLPYFTLRNSTPSRFWFQVVFKFEADPGGLQAMDLTQYLVPATIFNRGHLAQPTDGVSFWDADPYFGTKEAATPETTTSLTQHYNASDDTLTFYLDPADPSNPWVNNAPWEFEIQRGWGGSALYTNNSMRYWQLALSGVWSINDGSLRDINERSEMRLRSVLTVVDTPPIAGANYGSISLRTKNFLVEKLSVKASPYMNTWNGTNWHTVAVTSNPAAYIRRAWTDKYLAYPMPDAVRSDTDLQALWDECATEGLTIDTIIENNMTIDRFVSLCCEAGYAKKRNGATRGVWLDNDRSGDEIAGILTPHNARNFEIARPLDDVPQAIISPWRDSTDDYRDAEERITYRSPYNASTPNLRRLQIAAPGKVTSADVDEWQQRKLDEYVNRTMRFRAEIDWEQMEYEVGDLIGIAWYTLGLEYGSGVVKEVLTSGANVTGLKLVGELPITAAAALGNVGLGIRYSDGTIVHHQITNTTDSDTITFTTPFAIPAANPPFWGGTSIWDMLSIWTGNLKAGVLVWAGPLDLEERRCLITDITQSANLEAIVTMVDEAAAIHP